MTSDRRDDAPATDHPAQAAAAIDRARALRDVDLDRAREAAQRGLDLLLRGPVPPGGGDADEAELRLLLGSLDRQNGHLEASVVQFLTVLKLLERRPPSRQVCEAWAGLAKACIGSGDFSRALRYALRALKTARELGLLDQEAHAQDLLGSLYAIFGDAAEALQHLDAAEAIARGTGLRRRLGSVLNNRAMTLLGRGELQAALQAAQDALRLAREDGVPVLEANVIDTVARVLVAMGDLSEAERCLVPAIANARRSGPPKVLCELLANLGGLRAASGDPAQAEALAAEALAIALQIGSPLLAMRCHRQLADLFAGCGRWQDAYREFRAYHDLEQSIAGARAATRLTVVRIADELDAQQDEAPANGADAGTTRMGALEVLTARLQSHNRELAEARRAADAASQAKSRFLSNISHELRTPLNGVLGMAHLLSRTPLTEAQGRYCRAILASAQALDGLVGGLLEYARMQAVPLVPEPVPFEPAALVDAVVDAVRPAAAARGLALVARRDDAVPAALHGDARRIRQVLEQLVDNALKFTAAGSVEVRVSPLDAPAGDPRTWLRFAVADTGCGIDAATAAVLFSPFVQGDDSSTRRHGGGGMGLAIGRQIAEGLGGRLAFSSRPGAGSTFWLDLPLNAAAVDPGPARPS